MANYSNLAATINAQIKANGNQEITGPVLNAVLNAMVTVLGDGYRLKGVAAPADNPGSPDNRVAYIASQDGTYTNFGGLTISGEVALLLWDSVWTKATLFSIDTAVTPGSGHLVTSGAVDDALTTLAGNIAAAYMQLVPGATEGNLAEFDNAGQVRDAGVATADLATKDGHYPDLFAGFAGNLVDTRSAGTRQGPFAFRQSGGDGVNYMRKILGRTEAFNQIVNKVATREDNGVTFTTNADGSVTISGIASAVAASSSTSIFTQVDGHIYLTLLKNATNDICMIGRRTTGFPGTNYGEESHIGTAIDTGDQSVGIVVKSGADFSTPVTVWPMVVDLTLEGLGLTTADQFRALHPLAYYSPNAGALKNNAATGLETTGFNQWDEEWEQGEINSTTGVLLPSTTQIRSKNFIRAFSNTEYYIKCSVPTIVICYDASKNCLGWCHYAVSNAIFTTKEGTAFIKFCTFSSTVTTYNHDICINLSDPDRNGEYEPYWKREIVLGLDNLACHDENNNAVVVNGLDGVGTSQDELIVENGWGTKINKKRKRVNLGDLTWINAVAANGFFRAVIPDMKQVADTIVGITSKYAPAAQANGQGLYNATEDKAFCTNGAYGGGVGSFAVRDSSFANYTTEQVAAALNGVYLDFELATPKVLTLDNPIPAFIEVDNLGTERRLPEDTADNPQGPFESDSNYSVSTANLVRLLNL